MFIALGNNFCPLRTYWGTISDLQLVYIYMHVQIMQVQGTKLQV